jgi:hypothetical protein
MSIHTTHLEHEPLLQVEPLQDCGEGEFMVGIISIDKALDNGAGFPESDVNFGALGERKSAVGVQGEDDGAFGVLQ